MRSSNEIIRVASSSIAATLLLLLPLFPATAQDAQILVQGAPLVGSSNGMFFDTDNKLYVANVFGQTISLIDPETGEILDQLGAADLVFFPDDVTVGADGSLYWTDPGVGSVFRRLPGGPSFNLVPFTGFPSANPLTLSDDGRLFFAQCYELFPNGIFEADPNAVDAPVLDTIRDEDFGCASNAMDWWDGALYSPRVFEGRVVEVDIDTGALTDVTTGWGVPIAVKFNSQGELHAANQGNGEVVRIDRDNPDLANNREVLAQLPAGWLDNMAFDANDRLFVSSFSDGAVLEVLPDGELRTVSPGGLIIPMGLAVIGDTVYTANPATLSGYDTATGEEVSLIRSVFGFGPLPPATSVVAWNEDLVVMSAISGDLVVWDPETETPVLGTLFELPLDAQPFQGDLVVSESGTGNVVRAAGPDLSDREILATTTLAGGLAATEDDLYVSDPGTGEVLQVVEDGEVLDPPKTVASGFVLPEGIALRSGGNKLLVVDGGAQSLVEVNLKSGNVKTIATDLGFQTPIPGVTPAGWFNDVAVDASDAMYVNADRANVIHKLRSHGNACGLGFELALLLPGLMWLRQRRRRIAQP
jgi:sugar lactone lactonase YvrE